MEKEFNKNNFLWLLCLFKVSHFYWIPFSNPNCYIRSVHSQTNSYIYAVTQCHIMLMAPKGLGIPVVSYLYPANQLRLSSGRDQWKTNNYYFYYRNDVTYKIMKRTKCVTCKYSEYWPSANRAAFWTKGFWSERP